jgi:hypothetical protein
MIDKIGNNQIPDLLGKSLPNRIDSNKTSTDSDADVTLQIDYASLLNKAAQIPQDDAKAIQRAQELLASGQLESPENIREAAKNIIEFGI